MEEHLVLSHMRISKLYPLPFVEMVRSALCSVCILCSMLECILSTLIVLDIKQCFIKPACLPEEQNQQP